MKAVLTLIVLLCVCGCTRTKRFTMQAVMEDPGILDPGDEIRVAYRNGEHAHLLFTGMSRDSLHTETGPVAVTDLRTLDIDRIDLARVLGRACAILGASLGLLTLINAFVAA